MKRTRSGSGKAEKKDSARKSEEDEDFSLLSNGRTVDDTGADDGEAIKEKEGSNEEEITSDDDEGGNVDPNDKKGIIPDSDSEDLLEEPDNLAELSDSEDSVGEKNRIGNVPLEWYDEEDHIGYNVAGKKIMRKDRGDLVDEFLARTDDPNRWRTIYDKLNDEKIVLSKDEMDIVHRIRQGKFPERSFDPYQDYGYKSERMVESMHNATAPKRSFIPSKHEEKLVQRIVRAIRNGWIRKPEKELEKPKAYNIWDTDANAALPAYHIPAPKMKMPGHAESYNPPEEYLPTEEEKAKWNMEAPEDRPYNFTPMKFDALREVPGYDNLIKERFERCLDLYLCPRARRKRLNIDPETLIPKLPKADTLKPFPTECMITYEGHEEKVRTISPSPDGQWLASGSDDKTVRIWEVGTGRCVSVVKFDEIIDMVAWNPNLSTPVLAIATLGKIILMHTGTGSEDQVATVEGLFKSKDDGEDEKSKSKIEWKSEKVMGGLTRIVLDVKKRMRSMRWHRKGDYLCSSASDSTAMSVQIHRMSTGKTMFPFSKSKGHVQQVEFHPLKPFFFVVTKRHIRVYNLQKQEMVKKMQSPAKWLSSISIHPAGDNLIVGSYDCRVCWYDMDLSSMPYKTLKYHKKAVRQVNFHRSYPLFASSSDDGKLHIFHGKVYDDLLTNPMIVPVKILKAHDPVDGLGILDCKFHPSQPWIFSSGADKLIKLYC
mmetsp:Transcript_2035/g.2905  ORF Transcript_2035/g.2905 Transcript_2035/m.2905 type:complete len:711 (-) Transcript_2035:158-2290(-)